MSAHAPTIERMNREGSSVPDFCTELPSIFLVPHDAVYGLRKETLRDASCNVCCTRLRCMLGAESGCPLQ